MNLFWKNLFGKITPTLELEKREEELVVALNRYDEVAKSKELEEYSKLFHEVKSAAFIEHKKTLQSRKYKDTEECKMLKEYTKLVHSSDLKQYQDVLKSADLKQFLLFEKTPDYEKLGDKKAVAESTTLQKYKEFEKSASYKLYCRFHDSYALKRYEELKAKVETPEFKTQNEFWANAHRWQTTLEFKKEQRFYDLAKNPDIAFYIAEKPERFEAYRKQVKSFEDSFNWNSLSKSVWNYGFQYGNDKAIGNHSFVNEKQANNDGKNVRVNNGILTIHTKKETLNARAWDQKKGFVMKDFDYTSDIIQTAQHFRQKGGVFMAKIRCTGNVNHAFWLGANSKLPHVNIFHFDGKKIHIGNATKNVIDGATITGINPSQFYIYTFKWTKSELVWMINNIEVYRTKANIPQEEMYMAFNSFIPAKSSGSEGLFEIDWVRVYA